MYSEISNQFLYTQEEFENTKSRDLLTLNCPCCNQNFQFTKHKIQTNWRRSSAKILYCSYECSRAVMKEKQKTEIKECLNCFLSFEITLTNRTKDKKFCSKSCCMAYHNNNRTEEERLKINSILSKKFKGKTLIKYKQLTIKLKNVFTLDFNKSKLISTQKLYLLNCTICSTVFNSLRKTQKTCSPECFKKRMQQVHAEKPHLILNRSNPESYLEKSFREYIESKGFIKDINYNQEFNFTLSTGKRYIADFYFPTLNVIVEMDGTQHKDTIEEDKLRDDLIFQEFNIKTLRITHKEWIKKLKVDTINNTLNITEH